MTTQRKPKSKQCISWAMVQRFTRYWREKYNNNNKKRMDWKEQNDESVVDSQASAPPFVVFFSFCFVQRRLNISYSRVFSSGTTKIKGQQRCHLDKLFIYPKPDCLFRRQTRTSEFPNSTSRTQSFPCLSIYHLEAYISLRCGF